MSQATEKLVLLFALCTVLEFGTATAEKWTTTSQPLTVRRGINRKVKRIFDVDSLVNPGFVYAACVSNEASSDSTCNLFMETNKAIGLPEHVRSCTITAPIRESSVVTRMVQLDNNTAVIFAQKFLLSENRDPDSIAVIVTFSDCKTKIVEVGWDATYGRISVPINGTFDLIGMSSCEGGWFCRMTINYKDGKVVVDAHEWFKQFMEAYAAIRSPTGELLVVSSRPEGVERHRVLTFSANDDDGNVRVLKEYPVDSRWYYENGIAHSSSHNLLSGCAAVNSTATCAQFNRAGGLEFETAIRAVKTACFYRMKMFNLPDGGFLLLYGDCIPSKETTDIFVTKVNFLGQRFKTLKLTKFTGSNMLELMHFFVDEKGDYCLSQILYRSTEIAMEIACFGQNEMPIEMMEVGANY